MEQFFFYSRQTWKNWTLKNWIVPVSWIFNSMKTEKTKKNGNLCTFTHQFLLLYYFIRYYFHSVDGFNGLRFAGIFDYWKEWRWNFVSKFHLVERDRNVLPTNGGFCFLYFSVFNCRTVSLATEKTFIIDSFHIINILICVNNWLIDRSKQVDHLDRTRWTHFSANESFWKATINF